MGCNTHEGAGQIYVITTPTPWMESHALIKNSFDKSAGAALYSPTTSLRSAPSFSGDRNSDVCGSEVLTI